MTPCFFHSASSRLARLKNPSISSGNRFDETSYWNSVHRRSLSRPGGLVNFHDIKGVPAYSFARSSQPASGNSYPPPARPAHHAEMNQK